MQLGGRPFVFSDSRNKQGDKKIGVKKMKSGRLFFSRTSFCRPKMLSLSEDSGYHQSLASHDIERTFDACAAYSLGHVRVDFRRSHIRMT